MQRVHITSVSPMDTENDAGDFVGWFDIKQVHECKYQPEWILERENKSYVLRYMKGMGRIFTVHGQDESNTATAKTTSVLFYDIEGNPV